MSRPILSCFYLIVHCVCAEIPGSNKPKDKADKAEEENDSVESESDSASDQEFLNEQLNPQIFIAKS